jgi:hypothetical protein
MIQIILVTLPALWLSVGLGVLGQRVLPLLPIETVAYVMANAALLREVGIAMVVVGLLVLVLEVLRHKQGVVLDNIFIGLGGLFWLAGATFGGDIWRWLAVPVFVVLFTPALACVVILTILDADDSIDASLLVAGIFAILAGALHWFLWLS